MRKLSLVLQGLFTIQGYLCLSPVSYRVYVDQFLVSYVVFCRSFFVTLSYSFYLSYCLSFSGVWSLFCLSPASDHSSVFLRRLITLIFFKMSFEEKVLSDHIIFWGIFEEFLLSEWNQMYLTDHMIVLMKIQNNIKKLLCFYQWIFHKNERSLLKQWFFVWQRQNKMLFTFWSI